jgi:hypothetical protein
MALIRVRVRGLVVDERNKSPVVILQEEGGERILPIWIGEPEARAIGLVLSGEEPERPLTHDLILLLIKSLGATVTAVTITSLKNNTFFAEIRIDAGGEPVLIDARPSDSIAIALRAEVPISVDEEVLASGAGVGLRAKPEPEKTEKEKAAELRKFLEDMDPGDFGRFGL